LAAILRAVTVLGREPLSQQPRLTGGNVQRTIDNLIPGLVTATTSKGINAFVRVRGRAPQGAGRRRAGPRRQRQLRP
jgi:hypothetical protein